MNEQSSVDHVLDRIAGILIRCFVAGTIFLVIWAVMVMRVPGSVWQMHSQLFNLSQEQVSLIHYAGMLMFKAGIFAFFLFPYIGIKLVLRKKN